jgi:hypothetical protein
MEAHNHALGNAASGNVCPACGYCPHCGRRNYTPGTWLPWPSTPQPPTYYYSPTVTYC